MAKNIKRVFFWVEAGYVWGKGMSDKKHALFFAEIKEILDKLKFEYKETSKNLMSSCPIGYKDDDEYIYCHPMNLSGLIDTNSIPKIEKVLLEASTFKFERTAIHEPLANDRHFLDNRKR